MQAPESVVPAFEDTRRARPRQPIVRTLLRRRLLGGGRCRRSQRTQQALARASVFDQTQSLLFQPDRCPAVAADDAVDLADVVPAPPPPRLQFAPLASRPARGVGSPRLDAPTLPPHATRQGG